MKTSVAIISISGALAFAAATVWLAGYREPAPPPSIAASATASNSPPARTHVRPDHAANTFSPPEETDIPKNQFGEMVRLGEKIFEDPRQYAPNYVGNTLRCSSCHLDAGRRANSAPFWAAYVSYPEYRTKNKKVNTFEERLQGCFQYSMNGKAPPLGDPTLVALESYAYWLATGAPIDPKLSGRGYPKVAKPPLAADFRRGQFVYQKQCALCHGPGGAGQQGNDGSTTFPALWGDASFNWGAGMASVKNAAAFIQANMPLSRENTLSDQDAWDVATYMDGHDRPQDPRYTQSVAATRLRFHDSAESMYGVKVDGHVLGQGSTQPGGLLRKGAGA